VFRGNHPTRVDEKGRLKLPADYKRRVDKEYGDKFYITSKDGKRAEIWPLKEWEAIEAKLAEIPNMNPVKQRFLDVTNYYGQMAEMDPQGRLLMPQILRDSAKVTGDVVVLGMQTFLAVMNREEFEAQVPPLTATDLAALADLGL